MFADFVYCILSNYFYYFLHTTYILINNSARGYPLVEPPPVKLDEASQRIQQDILTITQKIADMSSEPRSAPSSSPFVVGVRQQAETERKVISK